MVAVPSNAEASNAVMLPWNAGLFGVASLKLIFVKLTLRVSPGKELVATTVASESVAQKNSAVPSIVSVSSLNCTITGSSVNWLSNATSLPSASESLTLAVSEPRPKVRTTSSPSISALLNIRFPVPRLSPSLPVLNPLIVSSAPAPVETVAASSSAARTESKLIKLLPAPAATESPAPASTVSSASPPINVLDFLS